MDILSIRVKSDCSQPRARPTSGRVADAVSGVGLSLRGEPDPARMGRSRTKRFGVAAISIALCMLALPACQSKTQGPATVPISGKISHNGQPVDNASVVFYPADGEATSKPAQGVTQTDGTFTVKTHVVKGEYKEGIEPGQYRVTVSKSSGPRPVEGGGMLPPTELLPLQFTQPQSTRLSATVTEVGDNHFEFNLDD